LRKAALILFVCGLSSLILGSALAIPSVRSKLPFVTITSYGTIRQADDSSSEAAEASVPEQISDQTSLDIIGYFTILAGIGFFATGLVISRKRDEKRASDGSTL
jgi:hypothetical protein